MPLKWMTAIISAQTPHITSVAMDGSYTTITLSNDTYLMHRSKYTEAT